MVFSSPLFLSIFLPSLFTCYFLSPTKIRNSILLVFSLFFYAWGEPFAILIMIALIIISWLLTIYIYICKLLKNKINKCKKKRKH